MIERIPSKSVEKVWGSTQAEPWFPNAQEKIGEFWFEGSDNFPLLIKFLFTTENLSVQVHPNDDFAQKFHPELGSAARGKTEMWHILRAEPGAQIAAGFREPITPERLRKASESGEIEQLLEWHDANPGDTFFIPAGTVHAIGAGLVLCEIQQLSDITYRLYDYGRPRELHLDSGVRVSHLGPAGSRQQPQTTPDGSQLLVQCPYFTTERRHIADHWRCAASTRERRVVIVDGQGEIGGQATRAGEVWRLPVGAGPMDVIGPVTILLTY
jgi:mannose-6-phosphate isomerase